MSDARQLRHSVVEQARVIQHHVVEIVFGTNTQDARFDAQIDVLRYENRAGVRMRFLQSDRYAQYAVVGIPPRQRGGQSVAHILGLKVNPPRIAVAAPARQWQARIDTVLASLADEAVQEPTHMPRVPGNFRQTLFRRIQSPPARPWARICRARGSERSPMDRASEHSCRERTDVGRAACVCA